MQLFNRRSFSPPPRSISSLSHAVMRETPCLCRGLFFRLVCSYEPDEESVHTASTTGDSTEDRDGQSQASATASSRGGVAGAGGNASGSRNGDGEPPPPVPWDPPTGTWSVRFPSFQTKSIFLHRTSIRQLRRSLATPSQGDGNGDNSIKMTTLPVFLERREVRPEPVVEEGKAGGKGAKKGGGKKSAAGKKGEASEPPPRPLENPWRCRAEIDLLPLVQPVVVVNGGALGESKGEPTLSPAAGSSVGHAKAGDSPLQAELSAGLTLAPPPAENAALIAANVDGVQTEDTAPRASGPAATGGKGGEIGVRMGMGYICLPPGGTKLVQRDSSQARPCSGALHCFLACCPVAVRWKRTSVLITFVRGAGKRHIFQISINLVGISNLMLPWRHSGV